MLICLVTFMLNLSVGLLYPIYSSLKLISCKNEGKASVTDVQRWVSYWILYGVILQVFCCKCEEYEYIQSFLDIVKCLIILFLALPQTNGSFIVYEKLFKNSEETKEKLRSLVKGMIEKCCACCKAKCGGKTEEK